MVYIMYMYEMSQKSLIMCHYSMLMKNNLKIFWCKYSLSDTVSEILQAKIQGEDTIVII